MLAYYVEWHLRRQLAPLLFEDHDRSQARTKRTSPVEKAQVSERAKRKADRKKTDDGYTVSSFPFAAGVPVRLQLGGNSAQVASRTYFHPMCRTDADSK